MLTQIGKESTRLRHRIARIDCSLDSLNSVTAGSRIKPAHLYRPRLVQQYVVRTPFRLPSDPPRCNCLKYASAPTLLKWSRVLALSERIEWIKIGKFFIHE